jgi:hypothetical protein
MTRAMLLLSAVCLSGCSYFDLGDSANPGNPFHTPYAGEPGSIFDSRGPLRVVQPEPTYTVPSEPAMPAAPAGGAPLLPPVRR